MASRSDIVETLARERRVERMVENISHRTMNADLKDLSQMVYLILLEYDEAKLCDLWDNGQMDFFIARIISNQYLSSNSPFHMQIRKFRLMVDEEIVKNSSSDNPMGVFDMIESIRVLEDE